MKYLPNKIQNIKYSAAVEKKLGSLFCDILRVRGVGDPAGFLAPSSGDILDPLLFDNMEQTVLRIKSAITNGEKITVYSDYDCDGVCSGAIAYLTLKDLNATVEVYTPDRLTEGYGTNRAAFEKIIDGGTKLIITVDCGIRSEDDVDFARSCGVDVIVLDHHECGELPDTPYIINQKVPGESYPFAHLCGSGIAYKLSVALTGDFYRYIDIAAVATMGDIVSLTGENRAIVCFGLQKLKKEPNIGLAALAKAAGIDLTKADSSKIAFGIVPRLNAAGRIASAKVAFCLLTSPAEQADEFAGQLCSINAERTKMQAGMIAAAKAHAEKYIMGATRIILVRDESFHEGIVGLCAQSLVETYGRPAVVFCEKNGKLTGSARSIKGVNLYELLNTASDLFIRFGGHAMAAGLTLKSENFEQLKSALELAASALDSGVFERKRNYDAKIGVGDATVLLAANLAKLEPFGCDNPPPSFLFGNVTLENQRLIGEGAHFKVEITSDSAAIAAIKFRHATPLLPGSYDVLGQLSLNEYRGISTPQLIIEDMKTVKPDRKLLIERNANLYFTSALTELVALDDFLRYKSDYRYTKDDAEFFDAVTASFDQSPIGTALVTCTHAGATAIPTNWRAKYYPEVASSGGENSAENIITYHATSHELRHYPSVFAYGALSIKGAFHLINSRIYSSLMGMVKNYMPMSAEFDSFSANLADFCAANVFFGVSDFLKTYTEKYGGKITACYTMLKIFLELDLIEVRKSGKIKFIFSGKKPDLSESKIYTALERLDGIL